MMLATSNVQEGNKEVEKTGKSSHNKKNRRRQKKKRKDAAQKPTASIDVNGGHEK